MEGDIKVQDNKDKEQTILTINPIPVVQQPTRDNDKLAPPNRNHHEQRPSIQVESTETDFDLISGMLSEIDEYHIYKSSNITRYATDASGSQLFSYSESILLNPVNAHGGTAYFSDNKGKRFLRISGLNVFTGNTQLGIIENPESGSDFYGTSIVGPVKVSFMRKGGLGRPASASAVRPFYTQLCPFMGGKPSSSLSDAKFNITIGGHPGGEMVMEPDGSATTRFKPGINIPVKAFAIALSITVFNALDYHHR